jgi:multiple sugar transport system permease protein
MRRVLLSSTIIVVVIISLFPMYWLILTSFQPKDELMLSPPHFVAENPTLKNYVFAFTENLPYFFNSLWVATVATVVALVLGSMSGYAFARYKLGGNTLPFLVLSLKFFPPVIAIVPYFLMMQALHIIDTRTAVIIPHLIITIPFAVWMIKGYVQEIPKALEEAAMIDGASQLKIIRVIVIPLIAPGLVVTALFCFIWSWNDFMYALVLTRNQAMTIPVAIAGMREAHGLMWGEVSATSTIGTFPIIVLAIILQKYLVRGLALGSVK